MRYCHVHPPNYSPLKINHAELASQPLPAQTPQAAFTITIQLLPWGKLHRTSLSACLQEI